MQLLIVWQSDLPHEAPWYVDRASLAAGASLAAVVAFGHFLLPFFALMSPPLQRSPRGLDALPRPADRDGIPARLVAGAAGCRASRVSWIDVAGDAGDLAVSAAALALRVPTVAAHARSREHHA